MRLLYGAFFISFFTSLLSRLKYVRCDCLLTIKNTLNILSLIDIQPLNWAALKREYTGTAGLKNYLPENFTLIGTNVSLSVIVRFQY